MSKELEERIAALESEKEELQTKVSDLETDNAKKDAVIKQKNEDLVGQRKSFKKLADMTEEEKEALSQKEIELQERQEALEEEQDNFRKEQAETMAKEVEARRTKAIKNLVGDNPEYIAKVEENFKRIADSGEAQTEEEIASFAETAFNMLGEDKPDPVSTAMNGDIGGAPQYEEGGFADTPEGQALAETLNLTTPEPAGNGDNK